jgi:hypothetical protein
MAGNSSIHMTLLLVLVLAALLAACGTVPGAVTPGTGTVVPRPTAVIEDTEGPGTLAPVVITSGPADETQIPLPTAAPWTPIPTLPSGASPTALKYLVLDSFPDFFFCDPDSYPVARGDEAELARKRFPELQANVEEFQAILDHNGLSGFTTFTDEQKLLIYREHKRLAALQFELAKDQYQFQLQIADQEGQGFLVTGFVDGSGAITIQEREPTIVSCPRCLAAGTGIDTPQGVVAVKDLRAGDAVWTVDRTTGVRRPATVVATARVPVPTGHSVVHVVLQDGRELWASPGHPTATGQPLGRLQVGDWLDGARVAHIERMAYEGAATYDLLPSGGTGLYWANGILVGSTLSRR